MVVNMLSGKASNAEVLNQQETRGSGGQPNALCKRDFSLLIHDHNASAKFKLAADQDALLMSDDDGKIIDAHEKNPEKTWASYLFGIQRGDGSTRNPGSKLIHPESRGHIFMQVMSMLLLTYTALYTPIAVGFYWNVPQCFRSPTLEFDVFLDCFFMFEIFYNFFVGVEHKGGYNDDLKKVAYHYVTGNMAFDVCTSIPESLIDVVALQNCQAPDPLSDGLKTTSQDLKLVRLLKPLRLLKMTKILKIMNLGYAVRFLESAFAIPHEAFRMLLTLLTTFGVVHLCACFFWVIKENTNSPDDVAEFLAGMNVPDTVARKYMLSCYFIVTVCTTVGFGDIGATNEEEQLFCMFVMMLGAVVFARLIAEVHAICANMSRLSDIEEAVISQARTYLRGHGVDSRMERRVLSWLDFDTAVKDEEDEAAAFFARLPPLLLQEVMEAAGMNARMQRLPWLRDMSPEHREALTLEIFNSLELHNYYAGTVLANVGVPCRDTYLVNYGHITVQYYHVVEDQLIPVHKSKIKEEEVIGEWAMLGDEQWAPTPEKLILSPAAPGEMAVSVFVAAGRGLKAMDTMNVGASSSDPYVTLKIGKMLKRRNSEEEMDSIKARKMAQTRVVRQNLNPVWNHKVELLVTPDELAHGYLSIQVWDKDLIDSDDLIGQIKIPLSSIQSDHGRSPMEQHRTWRTICGQDHKPSGEISLGLQLGPPSPPPIVLTRLTCSSFVSCKKLTKDTFDNIIGRYDKHLEGSTLRSELEGLFADVQRERTAVSHLAHSADPEELESLDDQVGAWMDRADVGVVMESAAGGKQGKGLGIGLADGALDADPASLKLNFDLDGGGDGSGKMKREAVTAAEKKERQEFSLETKAVLKAVEHAASMATQARNLAQANADKLSALEAAVTRQLQPFVEASDLLARSRTGKGAAGLQVNDHVGQFGPGGGARAGAGAAEQDPDRLLAHVMQGLDEQQDLLSPRFDSWASGIALASGRSLPYTPQWHQAHPSAARSSLPAAGAPPTVAKDLKTATLVPGGLPQTRPAELAWAQGSVMQRSPAQGTPTTVLTNSRSGTTWRERQETGREYSQRPSSRRVSLNSASSDEVRDRDSKA